jgi:ankyrin repeat protein
LVEKGADVNKKNPDGHTPFTNVLYLESVELIDYMGKHGADPNLIMADSGVTPLFHALQTDSPPIASMLIKMGADVNEFNPLILAVDRYVDADEDERDGYKKVIKELVEKGAILDNYEIDDEYDRPLQINSLIWLFDNFQEGVDEELLTM